MSTSPAERPAVEVDRLVSVVMGVYNGERYLKAAAESILSQAGVSLELVIINDGSTDGTGAMLDQLEARDERVRVFHRENCGLTKSLIFGCSQSRGAVIARQDADDISQPMRLARQLELLLSSKEIGFVSCHAHYLGPKDEYLGRVSRPAEPERATYQLLNESVGPPAHGSVMFKKDVYEKAGGYRPEFYFAQDSDLWLRMAEISHVAYCQEVLYEMRTSGTNISSMYRAAQSQFGELGQLCRKARAQGRSEARYLNKAKVLTEVVVKLRKEQPSPDNSKYKTYYLVGSILDALADPRAAEYFRHTLKSKPWHLRAWYKLLRVGAGRLLAQFGRSQAPR